VEIGELIVRDDELDVGDDKVASSEVAEGGTRAGRNADRPGNNSRVDGIGTIHVKGRNRTAESRKCLNIAGYCGFQDRLSIDMCESQCRTCLVTWLP
jgi:hypothetical protein